MIPKYWPAKNVKALEEICATCSITLIILICAKNPRYVDFSIICQTISRERHINIP